MEEKAYLEQRLELEPVGVAAEGARVERVAERKDRLRSPSVPMPTQYQKKAHREQPLELDRVLQLVRGRAKDVEFGLELLLLHFEATAVEHRRQSITEARDDHHLHFRSADVRVGEGKDAPRSGIGRSLRGS